MITDRELRALRSLGEAEAAARLRTDGPNEIPSGRRRGIADIALDVVREPMILLLVACGAVYVLLGDVREAAVLLASVGVVVGISLYQDTKTERALEALRDLSSPRALVIRDGRERRIPGREVVRGDLLVVSEGDRVPADAVVLWSVGLTVDESLLTGESAPVRKTSGAEDAAPARPGGDDSPFLYSGTLVVGGHGIARVFATGLATELGRIGKSLRIAAGGDTRLQREVRTLVRILALAGLALCAVAAVLYGLSRQSWLDGVLAGLALAMAMVPEEFPVILALFLAIGAWRIARRNVLVRNMPAVLFEAVPRLPFNGPISDARRIVWTSFALDDFLTMRGVAGCKVNDVVLAVIAGAIRRYLEARGVRPDGLRPRTLVPVSVRRAGDHMTLGNLVSSMFPHLPVDVADPVERLRTMAEEMRTLKEQGQPRAAGLAMQLAGMLPAPVNALLGRLVPPVPPVNTVCTNVPGPREACHLLGRRILEVHPIVPLFEGLGLEFAIMSYAGRLSIAAAVEPHLVPEADDIPAYLQAAAEELHAALTAGETRVTARVAASPVVADLMSRDVVAIAPDDSLAHAYAIMRTRRIRHLPVVTHGGRLAGLVTHRDLLAASSSSLEVPAEAERLRVLGMARAAHVMETHVSVAAPADPAAVAGERMIRHKIGCLPVVGADGRLAGIVTEEDFLRWATTHMAPAEPVRQSA